MSCISMATVLIFLRNSGINVEAVKTFMLDRDGFEGANVARNTANSGGGQWKATRGLSV